MAKKKLTKKQKQNLELAIILGITLISILLWNTFLIYPIKLFVILMHEISHALVALLTGGHVEYIIINSYLGGTTLTSEGVSILVASAGYLGSLLFGIAIFISAYNQKLSLWICTSISILLILFAANFMKGYITIFSALFFAVLFFVSPRYLNKMVHSYLMKILGLISSLYVVVDIKDDLITLSDRLTDAKILESITNIPAIVWGFSWLLVSLVSVYFIIKESYKKGFRKIKK